MDLSMHEHQEVTAHSLRLPVTMSFFYAMQRAFGTESASSALEMSVACQYFGNKPLD
jgi:hypothetical protein